MPTKKKNGKKVNSAQSVKLAILDLVDPDSSTSHPDIVKFAQTLAWIKSRHEKETRPKLEQLRQQIEESDSHREEASKRTDNINSYLSSADDDTEDPVIHILDLADL